MAAYTFRTPALANQYTLIAASIASVTVIFSQNGRVIVQDTADADPVPGAANWMNVDADRPYSFPLTTREAFFNPLTNDAVMNGFKE